MTQADHIIQRLGGVRQAAKILSAPITTVQSWTVAGYIPAKRQQGVINAAKAVGIDVGPGDFFEPIIQQEASAQDAAA